MVEAGWTGMVMGSGRAFSSPARSLLLLFLLLMFIGPAPSSLFLSQMEAYPSNPSIPSIPSIPHGQRTFNSLHAGGVDNNSDVDVDVLLVMAEENVTYTVGLHHRVSGNSLNFSFQYQAGDGLDLVSSSERMNVTRVDNGFLLRLVGSQEEVCTVIERGEAQLLGRRFMQLEISSSTYYLQLLRVEAEGDGGVEVGELPLPILMVVLICSILPFFLLVPDVTDNLQLQLEERAGFHARVLGVLLPLLTVAIAVLALQILYILFGAGGM